MALLALIAFLLAPSIAVIGGVVRFIAFFALIFGLVGGSFLAFVVHRSETSS